MQFASGGNVLQEIVLLTIMLSHLGCIHRPGLHGVRRNCKVSRPDLELPGNETVNSMMGCRSEISHPELKHPSPLLCCAVPFHIQNENSLSSGQWGRLTAEDKAKTLEVPSTHTYTLPYNPTYLPSLRRSFPGTPYVTVLYLTLQDQLSGYA